MRNFRRTAAVGAMLAGLMTAGAATASAAPFGSLGDGPDLVIAQANAEGVNACAVRVTNEGDGTATGVTVHTPLVYESRSLGTLAPGESKIAEYFDCGFSERIFYFATTSGETNWADNFLYIEL
ncbi:MULTISPECIES: hypothetical protein [unclassified Rhodococcus (in: high G+C Gram-positive bacteria)]|jgi:hypothetical protein|uniref:hypothetical protein n=1 Tax=unclassified Rhodococcus (in: high G+C Gram-positive bacteria) TaxID=192944 RepID=UPI0024B6F93E|nr:MULTISPECIES: hypothetical protein [unclassified Rhodococcus (in: high G+C Gram-positive bacteria)]MDI9947906.1 hypothetical protein [Rhodococcus sp. IEGM 1305]MDI9974406.1 hypothetical protein [Rhodococcus sp. IEGM 1307]